jgi:hypothetical protein
MMSISNVETNAAVLIGHSKFEKVIPTGVEVVAYVLGGVTKTSSSAHRFKENVDTDIADGFSMPELKMNLNLLLAVILIDVEGATLSVNPVVD